MRYNLLENASCAHYWFLRSDWFGSQHPFQPLRLLLRCLLPAACLKSQRPTAAKPPVAKPVEEREEVGCFGDQRSSFQPVQGRAVGGPGFFHVRSQTHLRSRSARPPLSN